jgi:predicted enzyme related to lactoylglutathione lyase
LTDFIVNIDVDDVERAASFYVDVFGLHIGRRIGGALELLDGPTPVYLLPKAGGTIPFAGATSPRDYTRHWTPVHLDFVVEDVEVALSRALAADARRESEVFELAWGRMVLMADPWGNGFCLIQFTGRGYDEIVDPQEEGASE